ncbi:DUF5374 domain-containing protein [Pasteurella sp. PK-2025]|uniref:DUF5374 domain-containing protein n=1 Tax=unclassified Pasteurella TaxID=2621516 RepID=UPI003C73014B
MISFLNNPWQKGMSLTAFLVALTLFSGIFLSISQWAGHQRKNAFQLYQYIQALQIAENQSQRQFLGLACEPHVIQNQISFAIECREKQIVVRYPLGEIRL